MDHFDVAIIGGGPAGLSAASTLARLGHTAIVFDSKTYRDSGAEHMHMVLTWEHKNPEDYREQSKANIKARYRDIKFRDVKITSIQKYVSSTFLVRTATRDYFYCGKVILAVGSTDILPKNIPGYGELWKERTFHCLPCQGWEWDAGRLYSSGVLAIPPMLPEMVVHEARNAAQLSKCVNIYTNGDASMEAEVKAKLSTLDESKFIIQKRRIKRLTLDDDECLEVEFVDRGIKEDGGIKKYRGIKEDEDIKEERFLVHTPKTKAQGPFVEQLNLATTAAGDIKAGEPNWQTNVAGVYAVGDCSSPFKIVPKATLSGYQAAMAVSNEILAAKFARSKKSRGE